MKYISFFLLIVVLLSCKNNEQNFNEVKNSKIGVLLVSHGSRSETWRRMLLDIEDSVKTRILANKDISGLKSAFMEYNGPSIADQMKIFDKEGYTDIIIVPIFLTVSSHSFDDIPMIVGLKSVESEIQKLKQENIEVYNAKANIKITPLLDFPDMLSKNLIRRIENLSTNPENEGCVLVAYGDKEYDKEWTSLLKKMMEKINSEVGINKFEYSWCGHIVNYKSEPTTNAINNILNEKENAIVVPILVAFDEMFQTEIIGGAIDKAKNKNLVKYKSDAILPDKNLNDWIVQISNEYVDKIISK